MMKKAGTTILLSLVMVLGIAVPDVFGFDGPTLEVEKVSTTGEQATVNVKLYEFSNLSAGSFKIITPNEGLKLENIEVSPDFDKGRFRSTVNNNGNQAEISFLSRSAGEEHSITNSVIAQLTYSLPDGFQKGESLELQINTPSFTDEDDEELLEEKYNGSITKERATGDVLDTNEMNAAQALRVLQHADGQEPLDEEAQKFADVDNDSNIAQTDAQKILDRVSGKRMNFLSFDIEQEITVYTGLAFSKQLKVKDGYGPLEWDESGLPRGLELNEQTGLITGEAEDTEEAEVTISVTDRTGKEISKEDILFKVEESNVASVESLKTVKVEKGEALELPEKMEVTLKSGVTQEETVTWEEFDTDNVVGEYAVTGMLDESGITVQANVLIFEGEAPELSEEALKSVESEYSSFGVHAVYVEGRSDVARVEVEFTRADSSRSETLNMHYEGNDKYSQAITQLPRGAEIKVSAYDEYNDLITEETHFVN